MNEEFNISQAINLLLPKWPFILICTLLVAVISFFYSSYMVEPLYVSYGTLYITGSTDANTGTSKDNTNLNDLMISQELAITYGQILSSNTFFKEVEAKSNAGYTFRQIQRMTSISNVEGTGLLTISVTNTDPELACYLANQILELAPHEISRVVAGSATIIDPAELPKSPSSPSIPKNTLLGALIGFAVSVLVIFFRNFFDKTIKSAEEIKTLFGLPVLGTIPLMESKKGRESAKV